MEYGRSDSRRTYAGTPYLAGQPASPADHVATSRPLARFRLGQPDPHEPIGVCTRHTGDVIRALPPYLHSRWPGAHAGRSHPSGKTSNRSSDGSVDHYSLSENVLALHGPRSSRSYCRRTARGRCNETCTWHLYPYHLSELS